MTASTVVLGPAKSSRTSCVMLLAADTAGHSQNMILVVNFHHSTHGGRDIATYKFILAKLVSQLAEILDRTKRISQQSQTPRICHHR